MTIHDDQPSVEKKSRPEYGIGNGGPRAEGVYPHLHEERGSLDPLSTSLPHHRSAVKDRPLESGKCRSNDQPSETEKNRSGYVEQRPGQGGSTHKEQWQPTPVNAKPLTHSSSSRLPNSSALHPTRELRAASSESPISAGPRNWTSSSGQHFIRHGFQRHP